MTVTFESNDKKQETICKQNASSSFILPIEINLNVSYISESKGPKKFYFQLKCRFFYSLKKRSAHLRRFLSRNSGKPTLVTAAVWV